MTPIKLISTPIFYYTTLNILVLKGRLGNPGSAISEPRGNKVRIWQTTGVKIIISVNERGLLHLGVHFEDLADLALTRLGYR